MMKDVDGYRLLEPLGRGGAGEVWRARHFLANEDVAIKLLHRRPEPGSFAARYLEREIDALKTLDHPGLARLESFSLSGAPYVAMELVEGEELTTFIGDRARADEPLSLSEVQAIVQALANALGYAHARGIVHRDLKPQNVIMGPRGPCLVDFGLVRLVHAAPSDATTQGRALGSPLYMAPEQVVGEPATPACDQFALASIAFELLTLRRAWALGEDGRAVTAFASPIRQVQANRREILRARMREGARPDPCIYRPELPEAVAQVIARGTAVDPLARFESVEAFAQALSDSLQLPPRDVATAVIRRRDSERTMTKTAEVDGFGVAPTVAPLPPLEDAPPPAPARRFGWIWPLVSAAVVISGVALGVGVARSRAPQPAGAPPARLPAPRPSPAPAASPRLTETPPPSSGEEAPEPPPTTARRTRRPKPSPTEPRAPRPPDVQEVEARFRRVAELLRTSQDSLPSEQYRTLERRYLRARAHWSPSGPTAPTWRSLEALEADIRAAR